MTENIIYAISKDVYNVYKELSINGLNISIEDRNKLINKLKKLINNEKEIYSYLSYEEISKVRDYFVKNFSSDEEISERIINKCDEIILNNYVEEFYSDIEDEEEFDEDDKDFDKKSIIYVQSIRRDLFHLKLYFLKKFLNNDGLISKGLYLNEVIIKQCINTNIFTYSSLYPNIENELINYNYEINDFCLLNKLSSQLSLFDKYTSKIIKKDALNNDFIDRLRDILIINENNISKKQNTISLLDSLVHILSTLVLDNSFLSYINKAFEKVSNDMIYYIFYDNLKEFNEDKKNIKILSLNIKK